jgi:hypothetical protein
MSEAGGPPYRDYLPKDSREADLPDEDDPDVDDLVDEPSSSDGSSERGTVFVTPDGDRWLAVWQGPSASEPLGDIEGDEETVLAWASSRPADLILLFDPELNDYVPLFMGPAV